jgi:hypothetical protein
MKNRGSLSKRGPRFTRKADEITGSVMVRGDALKAGFLLRSIILFGLLLMLLEGMLADETGIRSKLPWSFQPVLPQDAFKFRDIDDYIDDSMESHGIVPNPLADRWTLIRRATFDLLGLPPSPDEVLAFVEDSWIDCWLLPGMVNAGGVTGWILPDTPIQTEPMKTWHFPTPGGIAIM